jgi:divalent metal cation (Fe/Co/Zn/Cd) transporter
MGALPFRRMFVYSFAIVFVASACGFAAATAPGLHESPFRATFFVSSAVLVILGFFLLRWWTRVSRAAGVPLLVSSKRDAMVDGALLIAVVFGGATLAYFLYDATGNRLAEAVVSLLLTAPAAFVVLRASYAHMRPPVSQEAQSLRTIAITQAVLAVMFAVNVVQQIHARNVGMMPFHDAVIALDFMLIWILPIRSCFIWQRFARARASGVSLTTRCRDAAAHSSGV